MPFFIAVHGFSFDEPTLVKFATEEAPKFTERGATWIKTYCAFEDNKGFCIWESPDRETIEQIFKDYETPYDSVHKVQIFDVGTATLKD